MRRRSREIAIFNLSMMDVVTGAMGAFLIVMVVLARYYDADPANREKVQALTAELSAARDRLRDIDTALRQSGVESGDAVSALTRARRNLDEAEKGADDLREQLDQAEAELERKDELIDTLSSRRAFTVTSHWTCPGADIDIYVWDTQLAARDNKPAPILDPDAVQWQN